MNPAVQHLPLAMVWLAPELVREPLPDERLADCARCPLAGDPFLPDVRCCTYQPALPNFFAGRALRRGGVGAERVRARIARADGVGPLGISPPDGWAEQYARERDAGFGRDPSWRCPFWVEGPLSCSIWPDRNSVCLSWHCKHVDGVRGHRRWSAVSALGQAVERRLAAWCAVGEPPPPGDVDGWVAWYVGCAERIESASAEDLAGLGDDALDRLRADCVPAPTPMPDVLAPCVRDVRPAGDAVELVGYTPWHTLTLPRAVFVLLAEMDGERTWPEAVARARASDPSVDPAWVARLWDRDLLQAPDTPGPWGFGAPDLDPDQLARSVHVRR